MAHHHGSDTPTSPRAVLHHTDANLCTILHTTVASNLNSEEYVISQPGHSAEPETENDLC